MEKVPGQFHEQELAKKVTWRDNIDYPKSLKPWSVMMLDQIEEVMLFPADELSKYSAVTVFLREAEEKGLITHKEHLFLRDDIAQNI